MAVCVAAALLCGSVAQAQLRIATYNTTGAPYTNMDRVLKAIGEETGNNGKSGANLLYDGIAKPIDILLLQEQNNPSPGGNPANASPDTQAFVNLLNQTVYNNNPNITYAMSNLTGNGDTTQTLIYRTQTVQLIASSAIGSTSSSGPPRQPTRFQLRPVGYGSSADFYIYNSHYKASQGTDSGASTSNADRRNAEAQIIRTNSNALGEGAHIIYAGDHNFYDYTLAAEPAFQTLIGSGAGQANDPANQIGTWHVNSSFAAVHTQSPCNSSTGNCGTPGGMDDRFDFQLVSNEFLDGAGLSYIANSYHTFGNNGSTYNDDINNGCTTSAACTNTVTLNGITSYNKKQVLDALNTVTDHLPVVADYQIPAMMQASTGAVPATVDLGSTSNLNVTVTNSAPVMFSNGADVLHYSLTTSGSASGSFSNQNETALGGSNIHSVSLTTSTGGVKSATITLTSTNQAIPTSTINLPISFQVVLPGDYNNNNQVGASDYVVWRKNSSIASGATYFQGDGNRDGGVSSTDYVVWRSHFGQTAAVSGDLLDSAVPEPSSCVLVAIGICLVGLRPTRLRAWTRMS
jgi:hypothetical protein